MIEREKESGKEQGAVNDIVLKRIQDSRAMRGYSPMVGLLSFLSFFPSSLYFEPDFEGCEVSSIFLK